MFIVGCNGDDDSDSDSPNESNSVTISGITIPLTLDEEDKLFSQQIVDWNDAKFSYLKENKEVLTYILSSGTYQRHSVMDGYWDVRDNNDEFWILFNDGELFKFDVTTDGNNYIQYITRTNSDARETLLVGNPSQALLEQIAQDSANDNQVPDDDNQVPDDDNQVPDDDNQVPDDDNQVPDNDNQVPNDPPASIAKFTNSLVLGTWKIINHGSVRFNSDTTITEIDGNVTGISDNDNWRVNNGKLYIDFILYGSTVSSQIFTITDNLGNDCYNVSGVQTNSNWSATYKMCKR
ncbi:MAG: glycoside hydrolase family 43 C-terminal domain-containing protein [Pseudomonadota bacterium]